MGWKGASFPPLFLPPQSLPDDGFFTEADKPLHEQSGEGVEPLWLDCDKWGSAWIILV